MTEIIEGIRLSPQQRHLWRVEQRDQALPYRAQAVVRLDGCLQVANLLAAIEQVVQQHEILRTTFRCLPGMTIPLQVINETGQPLVTVHYTEGRDAEEQATLIENLFSEMRRVAFDLERGPLMQMALVTISGDRNIFLVTLPAMNADAVGLRNLVEVISRNYLAGLSGKCVSGQPMQYADSSEWHNDLLEAPEREEGRAYWREQDFSAAQLLEIPFKAQPTDNREFTPEFITTRFTVEQTAGLARLAEKQKTSPALVLLACWQILLWRLTAQPHVVVGCATDGRAHEELETALGLFERYLPVCSELHEDLRFTDLLKQIRRLVRESREYQEYFTLESNEEKEERYSPFCYEYVEEAQSYEAGGVTFTIVREYACTERFEVKLTCGASEEKLQLELHYDASRYQEADMQRLAAQYQRLVESVVTNEQASLSELEVVSEWERAQQIDEWNKTAVAYEPGLSIQELFERQVAAQPEAVAAVCGNEALSYAELNRRANQLGHHLRGLGVGPEVRVGLCVERSLAMVVGVLGILKAGGAYVPLDPSYPAARLALTLSDCGAAVVMTHAHLLERLGEQLAETGAQVLCLDRDWSEIAQQSAANQEVVVAAENLAYVIYTSGSTGLPKGVGVTQGNLVHTTRARELYYGPGAIRFLLLSSIAFDSSVAGLFWTLCGGGRLVVPEEGMQREARALVRLVEKQEVTYLLSLPSLYALLLEEGQSGELAGLRGVIVAGEVCEPGLVQRHGELAPQAVLYNEYGPTEGTVWSTVQQCQVGNGGIVPIGRPITNVRVYVLDKRMQVAPLGVRGELYVGGAGVTRGYLNDAALTALRFVPDPFNGESGGRLYRTGDSICYRSNGEIEFLGRLDSQVKVRGYRIELGEIEAVLREHAAVRESVVIASDDQVGGKRLVGYLVLDEQRGLTARQLLRYKREGLLARLSSCELPNGLTIMAHNKNEADYLYQEIFEEQAYFAHGIRLERGACVFDVGANIGLFSLFVGHICEEARIYAFEPIPPVFKVLRANAQLYGLKARLYECGLSHKARRATFTYYPHLSLMSGMFADEQVAQAVIKNYEIKKQIGKRERLSEAALEEILHEHLESEAVECRLRTISEVIAEEGVEQIDLLKIDAESSELHVLQGIVPTDWAKIKQVVVEVEDREQRLERIESLLRSEGFSVAIEQDPILANTRLYKVYAVRGAQATGAGELNQKYSTSCKAAWSSPAVVLGEVRELLQQRLPEHMIPGALVLLEALPLMPNGKVDRQALPAPELEAESERSLPRTAVEEMLASIWSEVLGVDELSVTANFFELGGHSLLATQVMSRVREAMQVELPVRSLFAQPTVRGLAVEVEAQMQAAEGVSLPSIKATRCDEGELPLSYAQQRLWFADQLTPGSALYNVAAAVRLVGELQVDALKRTLNEILRRHEVLRTSFPARQGEPVQVIAAASQEFSLPLTDLSELVAGEREQAARRMADEEAQTPFDLTVGPLVRGRLLRLGAAEHVALFTMHHIVSDGWSMGVLIQEVSQLYEAYSRGEESPLAEPAIQYADYAVWQREWLRGEALAKQLAYWREQLAGAETLALPTDKPRPAVQSFRGGRYPVAFTHELKEQLKSLSRRENATLFMTLLTAFKVLLHYHSKQNEIIVGANVANRNRAETEGLIGFFVNTVVLRTDLTGDPGFIDLLKQVRGVCLGAYAHQDVPFEKVVALLQPERNLNRQPLFQVKIDLADDLKHTLELKGLTLTPLDLPNDVGRCDLQLMLTQPKEGLLGDLVYDKNLFDETTVSLMSNQLESLLHEIIKQPEARLSVLEQVLAAADKQHQAGRETEYKNSIQQKFKQARQSNY